MKDNIFSNFYSKVLSFFTSGKEETESARNTASNRLKLVLMQDRSNLDGATMQKMREQLITVISRYIEIDTEALDLNLEGDGDEIALMLNIPVIRARTPEEIAEIEAQEEAEKQKAIEAKEENENDSEDEESQNENSDETEKENDTESTEEEQQEENLTDDSEQKEETNDEDSEQGTDENQDQEDSQESKKSKKNKNK